MQNIDAVVCGAGPAGLGTAACLKRAGLEPLILERGEAVASSWRGRYEALRLNSWGWLSRLPGLTAGLSAYPSRDEWVDYLERYARRRRLAVRFGVEVERIDRAGDGWSIATSQGEFRSRIVVVATGHDHTPYLPDWPGVESYRGELLHAAEFERTEPFRDRDVLIVGANTSGVELAGLLVHGGAGRILVAVRTPPTILTRNIAGRIPGHPLALLLDALPASISDRLGRAGQRRLFGDLEAHGLGQPRLGIKSTVMRHGKGPAIDEGFVHAIRAGRIEVVGPVVAFDGSEVVLAGGARVVPDAVIAATGYRRGLERLVGHLGVLDGEGRPRAQAGAELPDAPGLHFVGYRAGVAGPLLQIRRDAKLLARSIESTEHMRARCENRLAGSFARGGCRPIRLR